MSTVTIPTKDVKAGDKLLAINGHALPRGIIIDRLVGVDPDGTVHVHVRQADGSLITPDRYLRYERVTVERTRKVTRTVDGIKWIHGEGGWVSEDGAYEITYEDDFETECDHEHPVRITPQMRSAFYSLSKWERERWPSDLRWAIEAGRKGYLCRGGEVHFYGLWVGGPTNSSDPITRDDTLKQAMRSMATYAKTGRTFV